ncbi:MAG: hypothetical protein FWG52_10005 [Proteobacteria bacterium]|nr:hypothetical protein [Pseudomonadota bacterium]
MTSLKALIIAIAIAITGACGGWLANDWRLNGKIARINEAHADALRISAETAIATQRKWETTASQALAREAEAIKRGKEKDDKIRKLTSGRLCLSSDIVRMLNERSAAHVSAATGEPSRADAGTSPDPDDGQWATDADVAIWARHARTQYDACRNRVNAMRSFYE